MRFEVLHAEVGAGLILISPWAAHEDFISGKRLLHVRRELFQEVHEAAGHAGVLAGHGDLLGLHHLLQKGVEQVLPVLLAQGRRHDVEALQAGLLKCCLVVQALGVKFDALAVDIEEPQRRLARVLGQARNLSCIRRVGPDPKLAGPAQPAVAKAVERRIFALVLVVLLAHLLDENLHLIVGQGRRDNLLVVLHHLVFPARRVDALEVDADVEHAVVACAFWKALCAQSLEAWWAILDRALGLLWRFWEVKRHILHGRVVERVELFERSGGAVCIDGVAQSVVPAEVGQVQEVASVAAIHKNLGLLGKNLAPCFAQERSGVLEVLLEVPRRGGLLGEQEDVCAARLAAAHDHGQL